METPEIINAPSIPARERHQTIFAKFDALAPGQAIQLVNDHDPAPLFYQFQAVRPGAFEWQKVEEGPELWRVTILKIEDTEKPIKI